MKTEERGSETHLQTAALQTSAFPLTFPCNLFPLKEKVDEKKRDDCVSVLSHSSPPFLCFVSEQPPQLSTVNHVSLSFHWHFLGGACELLGKQIVYMSLPFLTAHFDDYTTLEFSSLLYAPPPHTHTPPPPPWAGIFFFGLLIAYKSTQEKKSCQLPSCMKRAEQSSKCILSYAQLHYIKRMFNILSHQAVMNAKYICEKNIFQ